MRALSYLEIDVPEYLSLYTKVLLHFDGVDGATTTIDENLGGSAHVWTSAGGGELDTAFFKFGVSSFLGDGSNNIFSTPDHADFALGSGDFTIDFWARCTETAGSTSFLCGQCPNGVAAASSSFYIYRTSGNVMRARVFVGGTTYEANCTTTIGAAIDNNWHHYALVRDGGTLRFFFDGVQQGSVAISGTVNDSANALTIGRAGEDTSTPWKGHVDEWRMTVGIARWKTTFTPPSAAEAAEQTFRFAIDKGYLPSDILAIPSMTSVSFTPATVSIGSDLGQRATLKAMFKDHRHILGIDSYDSGTFWGKFRARYGNKLRGKKLRWINGLEGQNLSQMETRRFIIESVEGPFPNGTYAIVAKDALKFVDDDRAMAPAPSTGQLNTTMTTTTTDIALTPSGVGNLEYPASGYVNIGGTEIAAFARDTLAGDDANAVLLLHCEGADASTTFTDSGVNAFTATANGNVQIDTADKKWDTSSALFDGTGDFISFADNAAWTFGGDFTLECQAKFTSLAAARSLICHSTDINNMYRLFVTTAGALTFSVISASSTIITLASANGLIVTGQWYHLAVARSGNVFKLYIDGVEVATVTDSDAIPNFTSTFKIGISGNGTSDPMLGWIDEVRVSNVARWTDDFSPPIVSYQASSDTMVLTRAQFNTTAVAHAQGERMQLVLRFAGVDPATIIKTLMTTYGDVPSAYINETEWLAETQAFYQRVMTANIAEPTGVNKLISEIIEQAALVVWWDDLLEKIKLQVIRPINTTADTYDESNTIEGSLRITEQPQLRLSQVYTYFNQLNPLKGIESLDNFLSAALTVDLASDAAYGTSIKTILSRWIPSGGRTTALRLNDLLIGRFKDAPRKFNLDLFRYGEEEPALAGGYKIGSWCLQDINGVAVQAPVQVTRLNPVEERIQIEAQEMLITSATTDDFYNRTIIIDADQHNVNMRTLHDSLFTAPDGVTATTITCIIESGVVVGSNLPVDGSTPQISFDVGTWPAATTLNLIINGAIIGHGGIGGQGGANVFGNGLAGKQGGTALYTRKAIAVTNNGSIKSGGGGGGGGCGVSNSCGGGGGGGTGEDPGTGGPIGTGGANPSLHPTPGDTGLPSGTGLGGNDGRGDTPLDGQGGAGGDYGAAGANGQRSGTTGGNGGAAGTGIDGISFVTLVTVGTIVGSQIN